MAQPKGKTGNPYGRPKGSPNRSTTYAREAIGYFVEGNVDRLNGWLDAIAEKDPKQAFDCFMSVVEYNIPKLARTEVTGKDGDAISYVIQAPAILSQEQWEQKHADDSGNTTH